MSLTSQTLPPGYSFQTFKNRDWSDVKANVLSYVPKTLSVGDCAGLAFSQGAYFFTYNIASKECWPKHPRPNPGTQTIVRYPAGTGTFYPLLDLDFYKMFEMPNEGYDLAKDSANSCYKRCINTDGCVIAAFKADSWCVLKQPDVVSVAKGPGEYLAPVQKVAGVIYPPLPKYGSV
ncbi:hypothetical protein BDR26DRAFT_875731 [Obelidium mucronatum]|nr:hypothetical protein BDR26DRAFT_875731 [Obelidium mucronatum]